MAKKKKEDLPKMMSITFASDTLRSSIIDIANLVIKYIDANSESTPTLVESAQTIDDMFLRANYERLILEYILNSNYTSNMDFIEEDGSVVALEGDLETYVMDFIDRYKETEVMSDESVVEAFDNMMNDVGETMRHILAPDAKPGDDWISGVLNISHYIIVGRAYSVTLLYCE